VGWKGGVEKEGPGERGGPGREEDAACAFSRVQRGGRPATPAPACGHELRQRVRLRQQMPSRWREAARRAAVHPAPPRSAGGAEASRRLGQVMEGIASELATASAASEVDAFMRKHHVSPPRPSAFRQFPFLLSRFAYGGTDEQLPCVRLHCRQQQWLVGCLRLQRGLLATPRACPHPGD
jgi:hypothetical protein